MSKISFQSVLFLTCWLIIHGANVATKEVQLMNYDLNTYSVCSSQYFDSSANLCKTCATGKIVDTDLKDGLGNSYLCKCRMGFRTITTDCTIDDGTCVGQTCSSCISLGQASYSDLSACVSCSATTTLGLDSTTGDCICPAGQVLIETDYFGTKLTEKQCAACPAGQQVITPSAVTVAGLLYQPSAYKCRSCPDPLMSMSKTGSSYSCSCPAGYTTVGNSLVGNQSCANTLFITPMLRLEAQAVQVAYHSNPAIGTLTSLTFQHYFTLAATRCTNFGGPEDVRYCQILANLCALQLFDDESQACIIHSDIITLRGLNLQNEMINWVTGQPWIYYAGGNVACFSDYYTTRITLTGHYMGYALAQYTMNGTFAGYTRLETLFTYCGVDAPDTGIGGGDSSSTRWQVFANTQNITYKCELSRLVQKEQMFYELFLYHVNSLPRKYAPVSVRVVNLRSGGTAPNEKQPKYLCGGSDVLVRRFFLHDVVSGIASVSSVASSLQAMRYASYISLDTSIAARQGTILPPVLTIEYSEVPPSAFSSEVEVDFYANYVMDTKPFFTTLRSFFIAYTVLTALLFCLRYYNWTVRNSRVITTAVLSTDIGGVNLTNVYQFTLLAMSTWVMTYFWFTTLICWYFFVFFKIQTVPSIMLPPQQSIYSEASPYFLFVCNLHVMAVFQLVYVLVIVYRQCMADLFFIDWEPAKTSSADAKGKNKAGAVSVWRTIMVANEWAELQSLRKTDIRFTLFALGLFLIGLNLQYNATQQPQLSNKSPGELNVILRFANTTFFWLVFSLAQYLWKFLIYERYISEPPEQLFVDFCTIAKVSVIVLDEKYHGYYLHCRSPHQYADGTMVELVEMLHKEEAGLTVDRSLDGAPADVQSFQIFLTGEWRTNFDKIYSSLTRPITVSEILQQGRIKNNGPRGTASAPRNASLLGLQLNINSAPPERVVKAWKELTVFLQEFVENNFGKAGLRRIVREPTYYEKLALGGPDLSVVDQPSVFFTDREYSYCKVLFLGRESELLLLNILSYSLFDLWFNNTAISMALCYLLDLGVCTLRQWWGQAMISKKTLIDGRFLI